MTTDPRQCPECEGPLQLVDEDIGEYYCPKCDEYFYPDEDSEQ